ncbi:MAG: hypothetical protein ACK5KT_13100 [Dysgonomonas sp.]
MKKEENKDRLKSLFQEMKWDEPSVGFESKLMQRIHIVEQKRSRQKNLRSILAIAGGVIGLLGIPVFIFWILKVFLQIELQPIKTDFDLTIPNVQIDPFIISIAFVALLLLIGDTLIRRRIWEKKHKH